jgi:hypothetical protein
VIILLLILALNGMQMVIDMEQLYDITTMEECNEMLPAILQEYNTEFGYCAYGDITNILYGI